MSRYRHRVAQFLTIPASPGCIKHFCYKPVQHGSSRFAKVLHGAATVINGFITVHHGSQNRDEPGPQTGTEIAALEARGRIKKL